MRYGQRTLQMEKIPYEVCLIAEVDKKAKLCPQWFAKQCNENGISYPGKIHDFNTLLCISQLEEHFGVATNNMLAALMTFGVQESIPDDYIILIENRVFKLQRNHEKKIKHYEQKNLT